jgi:N-acetylglutamate synthase-like GNAT family acetyltransferase
VLKGYRISTDINEMDINVIHHFISDSYWAKGIPIDIFEKAMQNSLCFAVINSEDKLVGFARMITDESTFAYLADVFILESHRGLGLGKMLMANIMQFPSLQGLRRMMLATSDAHELYKKFDFNPLTNSSLFMEKWEPEIYAKPQS